MAAIDRFYCIKSLVLIDRVLLLISARIDVMYSFVDCDRDTRVIEEFHHLDKGNIS